jgi:TolA-binding protein
MSRALSVSLCFALVTGVVSTADAAPEPSAVRYRRDSTPVKTRASLKTTVEAAKKREASQRKGAPRLTARELAEEKAAIEQSVADAQIEKMKELLGLTAKSDAEYPEHLFRLADLYLGKRAYHELQAGELEERIFALKEAGDEQAAAQQRALQKRHHKDARAAGVQAVKVYRSLVNGPEFTRYKRLDEALYYYAFELGQLGEDADMQDAYVRLVHDFPQSRFAANAYIAFGDHKFAKGDVPNAVKLYTRVVEGYPDSPVYAYALYKLAWCHLNPSGTAAPAYDKSLDTFVATIRATLEGRAGSDENGKILRRDARRDLVLAYVHAGRPSAAWEFFRKVGEGPKGEGMTRTMMERLAGAYFGEGKYVESSAIYRKLQEEYARDPDTCEWQYRIVVNALATDDPTIQWGETKRLADAWSAARDAKWKKAELKRCRDHARETLQQMATVWHDEADKTRKDETYARAQQAYEAYLGHFAKTKEAYDMRFYHAEVLWQQAERFTERKAKADKERGKAKFKESHDAFVAVLEAEPKGKWAKEAAFAQMLAMKNYLEYDETRVKTRVCAVQTDGTCRSGREQAYEPTPLTDDEQAMIAAYDRYAEFVHRKDDPELPKIMFHRAKLLMEHNRFDEAIPTAQKLVEQFDGTIYAVWGSEMLIDALTIAWQQPGKEPDEQRRAGEQLRRWAKVVSKKKAFAHAEAERVRKQVPLLLAAIDWKDAEASCERGREKNDTEAFVAGGRKYLAIYEDYDAHDRADEVLFNAARCLEAGYLLGAAIAAREELLERFPDSKLAKQTLKEVGQNFQRIAYYDRAAERFEKYASKYDKDAFSSEALQNAFLFRLGLGEQGKAEEDLSRYEKLYKKQDPAKAAGIYWARMDLASDDDQRLTYARDYIATYGGKGGLDRLAVAHAIAGQVLWRRSCSRELLHDVCVTVQRRRAQAGDAPREYAERLRRRKVPANCGSARRALINVHPRDPKLVAEARKHFAATLATGRKRGATPEDETRALALHDALGLALVYEADADYEAYLAVSMPEDLDFGYEHMWKATTGVPKLVRQYEAAMKRKADTEAKLKDFFQRKNGLRSKLLQAYADVQKTNSKNWILAAAARSAVLNQNFADQLYRAPVPKNIKTAEMFDEYCGEIEKFAAEPEKQAQEAFAYCLDRSTKFQYFNEFSRLCEDELQQRDADTYPSTNELFGDSRYTESRMDRVPVQTKLPGVAAKR